MVLDLDTNDSRYTNQLFRLPHGGRRITPEVAKSRITGKSWPLNTTSGNTFN